MLKISFVIFSCNSNKSSGLNLFGFSFSFSLFPLTSVSLFASNNLSSIFGYFCGTDTNPRVPRFLSFSRISIKFCENLENGKNFVVEKVN